MLNLNPACAASLARCPKTALLSFAMGMTVLLAAAEQDHRHWADYGGGPDSSHFVALDQINKSNVSRLQVAWVYPTGDDHAYLFNPIVVDNVMYVLAKNSSLVALDAATGKEIWIHENLPGLTTRGIAYWESKNRKDRRLIFAINDYLEEIDARTGKSVLTFGRHGLVDLRQGLGRDPKTINRIQTDTPGRVFENLVLLGSTPGEGYLSPPGDIRAFNVITGKMVWSFHTVPHPGEFGYDTWPKDAWKYSGGTNTWGEITVDAKRMLLPTGSQPTITTGPTGSGQICSPTVSWRSMRALGSVCGISRWSTTICGTTTPPPHRSCSRCARRKPVDAVAESASRDSCMCSIA
jgi:glucose dehydrogenase